MSRQEEVMMTWCQGMIVVDSWYNAPRDHSDRPVVLSQIANSTTAGGADPDHPADAPTPTSCMPCSREGYMERRKEDSA